MRSPCSWLLALLLAFPSIEAFAASVEKSIDLKEPADQVWAVIGPFCAIKDWHPAIGQCAEKDGVRTLTTKDGKGQFVEKQTAYDAHDKMYSYEIEKSPLPVTEYNATLKVIPKGDTSTVQWSSTYVAEKGKEQAAETAITNIVQAGLDNLQKILEH